jgi:FKBP-type peptidyl-prolyl cis-trans isomerase FklB
MSGRHEEPTRHPKGEPAVLKCMAAFGLVLLATQASAGEAPPLQSDKDRLSYSIGANLGRNLERDKVEIDTELLIRGLNDGLSGKELLIPDREIAKILSAFQAEQRRKQQQALRASGEENKSKGQAFLAENKTKEGVVTLPSGLQYKALKTGDGKIPTDNDTVEVEYRGTLLDGTEFDSSYRSGKPAVFKVNGVIAGWREALKLMPVGSRWQLFVPPHLAYAGRGARPHIGPDATLIFEVELLAIK